MTVEVGKLGIGEIKRRMPIYATAPEIWCREVVGYIPDKQQEPIIANYIKNKFTAVKSGHGVGKTASASIIGLHFISTRPWALIPCTAPTRRQLRSILWKEFTKWTRHSDYLSSILEILGEKIVMRGHEKEWYMEAVTSRARSRDDSNVGLQGFHGDPKEGGGILYLVDEASGVPEASMTAVEGALTERLAYALIIGNPTHLSGTFYNAFHKDSDIWTTYTLSCEESAIVDEAYPLRMAKKYGRDSDIYRIKVLGEFPKKESEGLIPLIFVQDAHSTDPLLIPEEDKHKRMYQTCGGLDVALSGLNSTIIYLRRGHNVFFKKRCEEEKEELIADWVAYYMEHFNVRDLVIDCVGPGSGVYSHLRRMGYSSRCTVFKSGYEPHRHSVLRMGNEDLEFFNLRAQAYWHLRDLFYRQIITLSYEDEDENLREQLTSIRVIPSRDASKIQIESKKDMASRGMASPDDADGLMLCMSSQLSNPTTVPDIAMRVNPKREGSVLTPPHSELPLPSNPLSMIRTSPWSTIRGDTSVPMGSGFRFSGDRFKR